KRPGFMTPSPDSTLRLRQLSGHSRHCSNPGLSPQNPSAYLKASRLNSKQRSTPTSSARCTMLNCRIGPDTARSGSDGRSICVDPNQNNASNEAKSQFDVSTCLTKLLVQSY